MDGLIRAIERFPDLLDTHGTAFGLIAGTVFCLVGYLGGHWVLRRQFYRRRRRSRGDPPPSYFDVWRTKMAESCLAFLFAASLILGFLCLLAGIVDWIDG